MNSVKISKTVFILVLLFNYVLVSQAALTRVARSHAMMTPSEARKMAMDFVHRMKRSYYDDDDDDRRKETKPYLDLRTLLTLLPYFIRAILAQQVPAPAPSAAAPAAPPLG